MNKKVNFSIKQALWQIPVLMAMTVLIAVGVNNCRSDGIPLIDDWSVNSRFSDASGESLVIPLAQARRLFEQNEALFVDARPENQYIQGYIQGALNIPLQEVDRYFMGAADQLTAAKSIVTYCDGESCDLSHELALFLKEMGFENVHVLVNGWTVWQQSGLPTDEGV